MMKLVHLLADLLMLNCFLRNSPIERHYPHIPRDIGFLRKVAFLAIAPRHVQTIHELIDHSAKVVLRD
jgi:hypothetical protein